MAVAAAVADEVMKQYKRRIFTFLFFFFFFCKSHCKRVVIIATTTNPPPVPVAVTAAAVRGGELLPYNTVSHDDETVAKTTNIQTTVTPGYQLPPHHTQIIYLYHRLSRLLVSDHFDLQLLLLLAVSMFIWQQQ